MDQLSQVMMMMMRGAEREIINKRKKARREVNQDDDVIFPQHENQTTFTHTLNFKKHHFFLRRKKIENFVIHFQVFSSMNIIIIIIKYNYLLHEILFREFYDHLLT